MKLTVQELQELEDNFAIDWEEVEDNQIEVYEKSEIALLFRTVFIKDNTKSKLEDLVMDMSQFDAQTIDDGETVMFTMLQQINNIRWLNSGRIARVIADDIF